MEKRKYIDDNGNEMMLDASDERVMTLDELVAKYSHETKTETRLNQPCPRCHTYCYGDCNA